MIVFGWFTFGRVLYIIITDYYQDTQTPALEVYQAMYLSNEKDLIMHSLHLSSARCVVHLDRCVFDCSIRGEPKAMHFMSAFL